MKIKNEQDLLNVEIRAKLIAEFEGTTNQRRKAEAFKTYECLKDRTVNYVLALLKKQFDLETVIEMQYAMTNISILRKVISKLAKVYANGVKRTMKNKKDTALVEEAAEYLKMNAAMKKANKYLRAFKNTMVYVKPVPNELGKLDLRLEVMPPFHYDVVENPNSPENALAVVISDYYPSREPLYAIGDAATAGRTGKVRDTSDEAARLVQSYSGTGIAGASTDANDNGREYIWWSKSYHFTTNQKGVILERYDAAGSPLGTDNPIKKLPFVNFATEQDGCFWAEGGGDLVDAGIQINTGLTNIKHVGVSQGYGQLYMTGKNLPKSVKVGPNHCVQLPQEDKDDPAPTIGYLSSNAPLADLKAILEMEVAFMLTTNSLSTSNFATTLEGGKDFASGVALMIDNSESVEDVNEQAKVFVEREPEVWVLSQDWLNVMQSAGVLSEEASGITLPKTVSEVMLQFPSPKPVVSELDELAIIEKRKSIGLNTELELIMRDDPSLSEVEAQAKLDKIKLEKQTNAASAGLPGATVVTNIANGAQDDKTNASLSGANAGQPSKPDPTMAPSTGATTE